MPPTTGTMAGVTPMNMVMLLMTLAAGRPSNRSRTIARAVAQPAAAPTPCTTRAAISMVIEVDSTAAKVAVQNSTMNPSATVFRPKASESVPLRT